MDDDYAAKEEKAFRVNIKIRNNRLLKALEDAFPGCSQCMIARSIPIPASDLSALINIRLSPLVPKTGKFSKKVIRLSDALGERPEYLFDPELYGYRPPKLESEVSASALGFQERLLLQGDSEESPGQTDLQENLNELISELPEREQSIIKRRFGLNGPPETLEQIAESMGITRERVRQIEKNILNKLRHPAKIKKLLNT